MTPYWQDPHLTIYGGDARDVLLELPAESVHCVVTSPPYWGLRDYGDSGQLGLEATPDEYVEAMVGVFREVRRVLRADGTVWLNLGDSYHGGGYANHAINGEAWLDGHGGDRRRSRQQDRINANPTLKPKDLVGIPWRVAFALQADGWYLRSEIIWAKPNPMPESVTDRPTKAHEQVFLLSKRATYFYDADAVREANTEGTLARHSGPPEQPHAHPASDGRAFVRVHEGSLNTNGAQTAGRNLRSVWTIATEPYPGAHFATFPRKLVEPCVKAGTSEKGVCPECGAPWVRVVVQPSTTIDWNPTCSCADDGGPYPMPPLPVPAVVLDPFAGSGTTLLVAQALGRRAIGVDLNPDYLRQCLERNRQMPLGMGAA